MFSAITLITLDKNNPNLLHDLKVFTEYRENRIQDNGEVYYTVNSLKKLIEDVENKTFKVNTFDDMYQYINNLINKEVKLKLKDNLTNIGTKGAGSNLNNTFGYLSSLFGLNVKSLEQYLNKEIQYIKPSTVILSKYDDEFIKGFNYHKEVKPITEKEETTINDKVKIVKKITNLILNIREVFNNENKEDNLNKNKVK